MQHPRPKPGARGRLGTSLGSDAPESTPAPRKFQALLVGDVDQHARFARAAVFEVFPYRDARAIDYDKFLDRKPSQAPRPSPEVWRMANGWATST